MIVKEAAIETLEDLVMVIGPWLRPEGVAGGKVTGKRTRKLVLDESDLETLRDIVKDARAVLRRVDCGE